MTAYRSLTLANLRMYIRNPIASSSLFLALLFLVAVMKLIEGGQGPHTKVSLVNQSSSAEAATLATAIKNVSNFDITMTSEATASQMLSQGKSDIEVVIPTEFGSRTASGQLVPVQLGIAYRSAAPGEAALPVIKGLVDALNQDLLHASPIVTVKAQALNARTYGIIDFLLPGVIAFNIIGSGLMVAAGVFANYKTTGVLRRLKATGIRPSTLVLAHATSSFVLGMTQTLAIIATAVILYSFHLDVVTLILVTALGYLVFLALGFAIAGWIKDPQRASSVVQSVAFPLIFIALLSSSLPPGITAVTKYLPVSYITDAMRQLGEGASVAAVRGDLLWLAAWALVLLVAAGRVFRWD